MVPGEVARWSTVACDPNGRREVTCDFTFVPSWCELFILA